MSNERASVLAGPHALHNYHAVSAPPGQPAQLPYPQVLGDQYHIKNENLYHPVPRFTHTSQPQWQQQQQPSYNQLPRGQPSPGQYPPYAQGPYQPWSHPQQHEYNQHIPYQNGYIPQQQQQQQQQQWHAHQQQQHPHTAQQYPYSSHHPNVVLTPPVYDDDDDEKYRRAIACCFLACCCFSGPLLALLLLPAFICFYRGKRAESRGEPGGRCLICSSYFWSIFVIILFILIVVAIAVVCNKLF